MGSIESLHLTAVLRDVTRRVAAIEDALTKKVAPDTKSGASLLLEYLKVVFGGWPALGFLFLLLFYTPLQAALTSIPEKVRTADEIHLAGVSLKSTIKSVAITQGVGPLADKLPQLSGDAIEFLLRAPRAERSLVSFTLSPDSSKWAEVHFPSERFLKALAQLEALGLVELFGGFGKRERLDGAKLTQLSADFKTKLPGVEQSVPGSDTITWKLAMPIPYADEAVPGLTWTLTSSGAQTVDLILKAVSAELARESNVGKK
ncbi:hypothetical protein [Polyangium mundeleinium]|uniref:Uncharacterized protein n=1 Tax=Polyangium mundeleinium TaxID=2995306 RepID=A0ABT5ESB5_9BACT|nr:hypothetical protein [Polyangium mundeleinium]MDC0744703.1 hypothetical protein [Polyangium mundeleinium]